MHHLDQIRAARGTVVTDAVSAAETERGEYSHLVALQHRYARLATEDPQRQRVRAELISGRAARGCPGRG